MIGTEVTRSPRFIPVHTGNTDASHFICSINAVHPRAYGEHDNFILSIGFAGGSSPCIRGTLQIRWQSGTVPRFIPVHTGNTRNYPYGLYLYTVHPRAYGEHYKLVMKYSSSDGSSPCIRGTPSRSEESGHADRFIPVHTGNTLIIID